MSGSLWDLTAQELLQRASSTDPTPGGGSIAAITGAFGLSLVRMAIAITVSSAADPASPGAQLADAQSQAWRLEAELVEAADRDLAEFEALMGAYRMPRATEDERAARRRAIDDATVTATHGPLSLAETCVTGIALGHETEPLVKPTIVSDVQAGRDLLRGAALAALRTADINLASLEGRGHSEASVLRQRREAVHRAAAGEGGRQWRRG